LGADGTLMLTAKHFDKGSKDNCTPNNKLVFAFSPDPKDTMIMYDCNTFKSMCDSQKIAVLVKFWVRDEEGNWDYVETYIALSKFNTPCTCFKNIAGAIKTAKGDKVQDVLVNITSNGVSIIKPFTTNSSGVFSVPNITSGNSFTVAPKKNDDVTNGVSTSDIVLMTKHILGQQSFTSPYQWIAADINKNGKVTTGDVVELRKIILGINTIFTSNNSWRFVDNAFTFKNDNDPLSEVFPEIKQVQGNSANTDFIAVKIGDINSSAKVNNAMTPHLSLWSMI
jgi:Dockerin type I domain